MSRLINLNLVFLSYHSCHSSSILDSILSPHVTLSNEVTLFYMLDTHDTQRVVVEYKICRSSDGENSFLLLFMPLFSLINYHYKHVESRTSEY